MKSNQPSIAWPYLCLLALLFILSITAPRAWQRRTAELPLAQVLAERQAKPAPGHDAADQEVVAQPQSEREGPPIPQASMAVAPSPELVQPVAEPPIDPALAEDVPPPIDERPEVSSSGERPIVELALRNSAKTALMDLNLGGGAEGGQSGNPHWTVAPRLRTAIDELTRREATAKWAGAIARVLDELTSLPRGEPAQLKRLFAELRRLARQGELLAARLTGPQADLASNVTRVQYALVRRLDVWENLTERPTKMPVESTARTGLGSSAAMHASLDAIDAMTHGREGGEAWREFLMVARLRQLAGRTERDEEHQRVARELLARLTSEKLTSAQRQLIADRRVANLRANVERWAARPVVPDSLRAHLEAYEESDLPSNARRLAMDLQQLRWGASEKDLLVERLREHYQNANLRIAISGTLLNRLIEQPHLTVEPVVETISGADVRGRSLTSTDVSVRLLPDASRLRIGLEASGQVASDTASYAGPARLFSEGMSRFLVRKLVVIGPDGLSDLPATADSESVYQGLKRVETDYDGLPIIGPLVRNLVRTQHDDRRSDTRREVERKLSGKARAQFDAQVEPKLAQLEQRFEAQALSPLGRLQIELAPIELVTTSERLVARLRLAGDEQLGAHTPRPQAPSDSLLSVQLHQSAINNGLAQLDLDGREFALPELFRTVSEKLGQEFPLPKDLPENVTVRFAPRDAVRFECGQGHVDLVLSLAELVDRDHRWRNFAVRARFFPEARGRQAVLVRESGLQLEGDSLRGKSRLLLRTIFTKALAKVRTVPLIDERFVNDPRLSDLELTQFAIDDGWIGLAYANRRGPAVARQPK
jgi:hypothetical protein